MKKLERETLSDSAAAFLKERSEKVLGAASPRKEAEHLWGLKENLAFEEIRTKLQSMATGLQRCMYCEDSVGTDIEHFWPKSKYPERAFSWTNYLLACSGCNSNEKRDQFPLDGAGLPLLVDPTREDPRTHLVLSVRTGKYKPRTHEGVESLKGQWSIKVFGLDRDILEKGRTDAWHTIPALLLRYDAACQQENWLLALAVQRTLCRTPFASVFVWFRDIAESTNAARFIDERCLRVLEQYPDIRDWL